MTHKLTMAVLDSSAFHIGDARSFLLTSASKFSIERNDGIFDVIPTNDRASPM